MRARQCDACGNLYPEEEIPKQKIKLIQSQNTQRHTRRRTLDLCPTCYKKIEDMFNHDETENM